MTQNTLGTLLRSLIDLLDGDVEALYRSRGLDYRPRFTPVMRVVAELGGASISEIQAHTTLSHSALSQTISEMVRRGLVELNAGVDGRQRIVKLTASGKALLPILRRCWASTNAAAAELSQELGVPLEKVLADAIGAVERQPFLDRMLRHFETQRTESSSAE